MNVARSAPAHAVLLLALSMLLLAWLVGAPPLHEDTARDLLLARDCVEQGRCAMSGPQASFDGLVQGALWDHLLEACRASGLGLHGVRYVVLMLEAVSAVLVWATPGPLCDWRSGLAAWALYLAASTYCIELPVLYNSAALLLPLALFYVCALSLASDGELVSTAAAGAALGLSVDTHMVAAILVPFFLGLVLAVAKRPAVAAALAAFAVILPLIVSSWGAIARDVVLLTASWVPCAGLLATVLLSGLALRRRARNAPPLARSRAVLVAACVYALPVLAIAGAVTKHPLAPRYFVVVAMPAAILAGTLLTEAFGNTSSFGFPTRRANAIVALIGLLLLAFVTRPNRSSRGGWNAFDAEVLAREIYGRGWTYADVFRHLRGSNAELLVAALAPYGPAPTGARAKSPIHDDLLVAKVLRSRLPATVPKEWRIVDLGDSAVAITRSLPSSIDVAAVEICDSRPNESVRCQRVDLEARDPDEGAVATVVQRAYPTLAPAASRPTRTLFAPLHRSIEVGARASSPTHSIAIVDAMPWRIERVDGVRSRGVLPGERVTLEGDGNGSIVFTVDIPAEAVGRFRQWLPSFVETSEDETELTSLLLGGEPR
jgi:hypothetical protein